MDGFFYLEAFLQSVFFFFLNYGKKWSTRFGCVSYYESFFLHMHNHLTYKRNYSSVDALLLQFFILLISVNIENVYSLLLHVPKLHSVEWSAF